MSSKTKPANDFKVLIVYPNLPLMLVPSLAIALFTSILKKQGYEVSLFETTGYLPTQPGETSSPENRVLYSQARSFSYNEDLGVVPRPAEMMAPDFRKKLVEFQPNLMVFSVVEDAFLQAVSLLEAVRDLDVPHILGGVFPTAAPDRCFEFPVVNAIGIGEGEGLILDAAEAIRNGKSLDGVPGVWYRDGSGKVRKNIRSELVDINQHRPDFSLFDDCRFYRPMGGRIFRTMPIETYRGCPYTCTFCNSPMHLDLAKSAELGNFLRRKTIANLRDELRGVIDAYKPEFLYFIDDSFLARPQREIFEFCDMYAEFGLPFWFNTRPENCSPDVMAALRQAGTYRISFGIECGNEEYRRKVLRRQVSNEKIIEKFKVIAESGIPFSINLIIGFPGETHDLAMDTVKLVRSITGYDTLTVSIFTPYHGTVLRDVAVRNAWLDATVITRHTTSRSLLDMPKPYLNADEIDGLAAVLPFYCYFPKSEWANLRHAERDDPEGHRIRDHYAEIYRKEFLGEDQDTKQRIRIEGATGCRTNPKDAIFLSPKRLSDDELTMLRMPAD